MPPAFVLSQDQTLHKNYFNNSRCQIFFKKNRFSSISLCNLNYIQIQCKLSGYIALFNFQTTAATQRPALSSAPLNSEPFCGVLFNITQVCVLSNFIFNFFQTFFISAQLWFVQRIAAWDLIYHSFEICQTCFQTFLKVFYQLCRLTHPAFCGMRFNISQKTYLSNFSLNFFDLFCQPSPVWASPFRRQGFKLPHLRKIANLKSFFLAK